MRRIRLLGIALVLLGAASCGGIPTDGHVTRVKRVEDPGLAGDEGQRDPLVRTRREVIAEAPAPGADPAEIVRGFFEAHAAENHDIARLFLAAGTSWVDRGVTIYAGERSFGKPKISGAQASIKVQVQRQAVVSETGEYRPLAPATVDLDMSLQRVGAQWRLSKVPPGLLLSELLFRSSFRRTVLYHPDLRRTHLVPDFVFLPEAEASVGGVLDRLLRGPSSWLGPAVRTAVPAGTRVLGVPSIVEGVAEVDLSREAAAGSVDARPAFAAQIVHTLTEPGLVTGVRLTVEGGRFPIRGTETDEAMTRDTWERFAPTLQPTDERLHFLGGGRVKTLDGESKAETVQAAAAGFRRIAVGRTGGLLAATRSRGDGQEVLDVGPIGGEQRVTVDANSLSTPSWDRESAYVWVVRHTGELTDVAAVPASAEGGKSVVRVRVDGAAGAVQEVRLAPDGKRAMVIVGTGVERRLYAARVESTPTLALTGLRPVAPTLSAVVGVAWASERAVQVIATQSRPGREPVRAIFRLDVDGYELSGDATDVEGLPGEPDAIAAALSQFTVVEVDGVIYRRVTAPNTLWTEVSRGAAPAYAG